MKAELSQSGSFFLTAGARAGYGSTSNLMLCSIETDVRIW